MKIPARLDNKQLIKIIKKQIRLCLRYRHFRSLIFVSMRAKRNIVFEYLEYFCKNSWFVRRNIGLMKCNSNEVLVCFKNGSFIRVIPATENARGHRANNVVIDSDVTNQEVIHCIIRPMIIDLLIVPPKWTMKLFGIKPHRRKRFKKVEYTIKI